MTVLAGARVVTPDGVLDPGWLRIDGATIAAVEPGDPPAGAAADLVDLAGSVVVPGFVDTHVHGGGGAAYVSGDPEAAVRAARSHLAHGTTTTFASLATAPLADLERAVAALAELVDDGTLAGLHLEGPWLSVARKGAHNPALLRDPDPADVDRLLTAGRGAVKMVTLAPERAGGQAAVRQVVAAGAVAAVGHTDASFETAAEAVAGGATVGTHLYNGMRPLHHREPGPIAALLEAPGVLVELIVDGIHLHPAAVRLALAAAGADRACLITDAIAATDVGDGRYGVAGNAVVVTGGVARVEGQDTLAGSTLTMDAAFRRCVLDVGLPLPVAARLAATNAARAHGLGGPGGVGALVAGWRADLVVLDADLRLRAVLRAGSWVHGSV